jgi:hypothetical protein
MQLTSRSCGAEVLVLTRIAVQMSRALVRLAADPCGDTAGVTYPKPNVCGSERAQCACFSVNHHHHWKLGGAMLRRSNAGETQPGLPSNSVERPLAVKIVGLTFLPGAALLLLGGAFREQANMISTGLLFLCMGAVFAPGVIRKSRILLVAFCALAILGLFYALKT